MNTNFERIAVNGGEMAVRREGAGEPVLLVHGITTWSFIWRRIVPLLADRHQVISVDLLGCGDSEMPPGEDYSLAAHAERISQVAQALKITKFHYIGHDLGGGIGQIIAVRRPESLFDLTMINTVAHDFWPVQPITALRTPIVRLLLMATIDMGLLTAVVRRGLYHKRRLTRELMELFRRPLKTPEGRRAFLRFAQCLDNHNLTAIENDLKRLALPTMVVRGDADPYLSPAISEKLARDIPGCRLERIASGGHFLMEDEPEWLGATILDFIGTGHGS